MKIFSFNINGLRAHLHQVKKIIELYDPFFIGLQETKINNDIFPYDFFNKYGYNSYCNGYKNHYGVALLSKIKANYIYYDFNNNNKYINIDFKYRIIISSFFLSNKEIILINLYTPQGESLFNDKKFNCKKNFIESLIKFTKKILINNPEIYLLIFGDINISPYSIDIGLNNISKNLWIKNKRCAFLPEEILWFKNIINCELIDLFRDKNPYSKKFTWFNYKYNKFNKNEGLRIDMFFSNKKLYNLCKYSDIDYKIKFMNKPSDHAPIWSEFIL